MKNLLLSAGLCLSGILCMSQTTYIPDDAFEGALIILGYDDVYDDHVLTANITHITDLELSWYAIKDLTGIEDFSDLQILKIEHIGDVFSPLSLDFSSNPALTKLYANSSWIESVNLTQNADLDTLEIASNLISNLDLSHNSALEYVRIDNNTYLTSVNVNGVINLKSLYANADALTSLDLSSNPSLQFLDISFNQISSLDLSNNSGLQSLLAGSNQISELDLSNNHELIELSCYQNNLTSLNVKNGNNINMPGNSFYIQDNPDLLCVEVDDTNWSAQNWTHKDPWTNYSENCNMNTSDPEFLKFTFYPNPVKNALHFSERCEQVEIYTTEGKKALEARDIEKINTNFLASGTYILKAKTINGKTTTAKLIKN